MKPLRWRELCRISSTLLQWYFVAKYGSDIAVNELSKVFEPKGLISDVGRGILDFRIRHYPAKASPDRHRFDAALFASQSEW